MIDMKDTIHRRGFLGTLAAGAATLGLASLPAAEALATPPPGTIATEFEAMCKKLKTRKHRQVFDAPMPNHGFAMIWSWAFLTTNNATGTQDKDLGIIVVLRHEAIPFAMEDRLWEKYKFGEVFQIEDSTTKKPSVRNLVIKPEDFPLPEMAMGAVQKRGVEFGVCDLALTFYSSKMAKDMNMDAGEVKKDWVSGVLPGIRLLPSGVWAVNRAQEHGFTYCFAG
jgi:intracellular sulfur oxidation DsrE/DsrF family protein